MKYHPQTTLSALICALAIVASSSLYSVAVESKTPERAIVTKAKGIVLPEFKLDGATFQEAVLQLRDASVQNDPEKKGVNFMFSSDLAAGIPKITLSLQKVTLAEATEQLAKAAGLRVEARDYAFVFNLKSDKP